MARDDWHLMQGESESRPLPSARAFLSKRRSLRPSVLSKINLLDLPVEILKLVLTKLPLSDLAACSRISKALMPVALEILYKRVDLLRCRRDATPGRYYQQLLGDLYVNRRLDRQAYVISQLCKPAFRERCAAFCQELRLDVSSKSTPLPWLLETLGLVVAAPDSRLVHLHLLVPEEHVHALLPSLLSCEAQFIHLWVDIDDITDEDAQVDRAGLMRMVIDCQAEECILFIGDMPHYEAGQRPSGSTKVLAVTTAITERRLPHTFVQWIARMWTRSGAPFAIGSKTWSPHKDPSSGFFEQPLRHLMIRMFRKKSRFQQERRFLSYHQFQHVESSESESDDESSENSSSGSDRVRAARIRPRERRPDTPASDTTETEHCDDGSARVLSEEAQLPEAYSSTVFYTMKDWTSDVSDPLQTINFYGFGAGWIQLIKSLPVGHKLSTIDNYFWVDCVCQRASLHLPAAECTSVHHPEWNDFSLGESRTWTCSQLLQELQPSADARNQQLSVEHVQDSEHCFIGIRFLKQDTLQAEGDAEATDADPSGL